MNYKINEYPDGTSYVIIPKEWENTTQEIIFKLNTYKDVVQLCQLCDVLIWNRVKAHITIPCLLDAQADKRFNELHSSGLVVLARIIDGYSDGNDISFGFFHPHNAEVVEAMFTSFEIIDNTSYINTVLDILAPIDNLNILAPDAGAYKWIIKTADNVGFRNDVFSASKSRKYENGKSTLTQVINTEDFEGKDILIIDDISVYGGTFKGLSKLLRERNCGKLYLAVSHMTIQNLGDDPVTNYFDKVFTTNSKFDNYYIADSKGEPKQPENLNTIKIF